MTQPPEDFEDFYELEKIPDGFEKIPDGFENIPDRYAEYWDTVPTNKQIEAEPPRRRGRNLDYAGDGVTDIRMSQTEVALRLARHLATSPLLQGNVYLKLGGTELKRPEARPPFPIASHLSRWGFTKEPSGPGARPPWIGFYSRKGNSRKLLLNYDRFDGHIMAFFATGQRLIVHCTGGNVAETRSPAEVHDVHRAIGRAIGWHGTKPDDVIAVCIPRSKRFRKLIDRKRQSVGVQRANLRFFQVDRGGGILGLDEA